MTPSTPVLEEGSIFEVRAGIFDLSNKVCLNDQHYVYDLRTIAERHG
jgi:hypothetical protein